MSALLAHLAYQAKAIIATSAIAFVSLGEWFVNNPDTAAALEAIVPAQLVPFVPIALGALVSVLGYLAVYFKSNGPKPEPKTKGAPVTELPDSPATTLLPTQAAAGTTEGAGYQP